MNRDNDIELEEQGWTELCSGSSDSELLDIAARIGEIQNHPNGQKIFSLKPKLEMQAIKGTFSNICGLNEFPLHTDMAFSKKPPKYVLMHSEKSNNCHTTLVTKNDFWDLLSKAEKHCAERAIYLIKTKTEKFFTSFIFNDNGETGIKYDSTCMFPFNKHAKEFNPILKKTFQKIEPINLKWTDGKTIIIDNWRNLHGRKSIIKDIDRELKRIYINKI